MTSNGLIQRTHTDISLQTSTLRAHTQRSPWNDNLMTELGSIQQPSLDNRTAANTGADDNMNQILIVEMQCIRQGAGHPVVTPEDSFASIFTKRFNHFGSSPFRSVWPSRHLAFRVHIRCAGDRN